MRRLPDIEHGYWYVQARSMHQLLTTVPFRAGQSILDVGSNTCWAANHFAERGLRAIALDIATAELQGLYTAEYFIDDGHVFFERVLGSMDAIPLASSSVDYVYCCEVLHHNDAGGLRRTFAEIFRVLRPGGRLLMVNETLKTLRDPHGVHVEGVEQYEGYEHAHWASRYRWEAMRAGFLTEVTEPHYRAFFGDAELAARAPDASRLRRLGTAAGLRAASRRPRPARLPVLAEPRVGRGLDEHDRHQAAALRRAATRACGAGERMLRSAGRRRAPAGRPPARPGAGAAAAHPRAGGRAFREARRAAQGAVLSGPAPASARGSRRRGAPSD